MSLYLGLEACQACQIRERVREREGESETLIDPRNGTVGTTGPAMWLPSA